MIGPDFDVIAALRMYSATFVDMQGVRKATANRQRAMEELGMAPAVNQLADITDAFERIEQRVSRRLARELQRHPLYPWLQERKGLSGPLVARLLAIIADPWRFPGKVCERGHHVSARYEGEACPVGENESEASFGTCLAPLHTRPGSGVRALWHYCGLHVVDGRLARRRKGVQCDWNTHARTLILQPQGIADQIIAHRTPPYREIYDAKRAELERERGVEGGRASENNIGPALADVAVEGVESPSASENVLGPLHPSRCHRIARTVAAKAFLKDLLIEWKKVTA